MRHLCRLLASAIDHKPSCDQSMQLKSLVSWRNVYFATSGLYVMALVVVLFVKQIQFHPTLGVVSRSLQLAAEDLKNFLFLLACLVSMFAMIGHGTFGTDIQRFSSLALSFETCVHVLLGDTSVGTEMRLLVDPTKSIASLYLWSYMLLIFTMIVNFMLAIIVDAFVVHKSSSYQHQAGIVEELVVLTKDAVLHLTGVYQPLACPQLHFITSCTRLLMAQDGSKWRRISWGGSCSVAETCP